MTDSSTTSQSKPVLFKVVVTGSECTGKTTLVQALAARFETAFSTEGARNYLDEAQRPLSFADVEPIARRQMSLEGEALEQAGNLAILDTDLVSTMIYSRHYYGGCKAWITEMAVSRMADLTWFVILTYLGLKTDCNATKVSRGSACNCIRPLSVNSTVFTLPMRSCRVAQIHDLSEPQR